MVASESLGAFLFLFVKPCPTVLRKDVYSILQSRYGDTGMGIGWQGVVPRPLTAGGLLSLLKHETLCQGNARKWLELPSSVQGKGE